MTEKDIKIRSSWRKMHTRCYDKRYHSYHRYGGRGIFVCSRWHEFLNFWADMEAAWFPGATIDRRDNDQGYEPGNCQWLPAAENKKPYKYDVSEMLTMYESGMTQKEVGTYFGLGQDRVSKLLSRARHDKNIR